MEIPILQDVVIIFALGVLFLWLFTLFKIPAIVSFLFTGMVCGPYGLGLVHAEQVEKLAEIGIMLLLFSIGLEFSLSHLFDLKKFFLIGGSLQVALTVAAGLLVALFLQRPLPEGLFLGFMLAMSSTAIVLKILEKQDAVDTLHGRVILAILIFQDVIAVPMIFLTPILGHSESFSMETQIRLVLGVLLLAVIFFGAIRLVPWILYNVAKARSRELFLLSVLTICFAVAWLASSVGFSLAIGAFLAGLIISETEYNHEAIGNLLPLQDIFSSLFFVSVGMLLDLNFLLAHPILILLLAIGVMLMKAFMVGVATFALGLPLRVIILIAISLSQIGEFAFVLAKVGIDSGLGSDYNFQLFLAIAVLTMILSPPLVQNAPAIADRLAKLPLPEKIKKQLSYQSEKKNTIKNHILIIGFGLAGKHLAQAAHEMKLGYVAIEMNPDTVKRERKAGKNIHYGDATHENVLHHANIEEARVIAIMINDSFALRRVIPVARKLNHKAYIIVRSRYVKDIEILSSLGADEVVSDEFGSSVEMLSRVLKKYDVNEERVITIIDNLRQQK